MWEYKGVDNSNDFSHGRRKGSRNGVSTTEGYIAIGKKAKGIWNAALNRYIYPTSEKVKETANKVYANSGLKKYMGDSNTAKSYRQSVVNNFTGKAIDAYNKAYDKYDKAITSDTAQRIRNVYVQVATKTVEIADEIKNLGNNFISKLRSNTNKLSKKIVDIGEDAISSGESFIKSITVKENVKTWNDSTETWDNKNYRK